MAKRPIRKITQSGDFSLYDISQEIPSFKTYVLSTPETRNLTTNPSLVGKKYRDALGSAIKKTLSDPTISNFYRDEPDEKINVIHFLRGGLNFEILDILGELNKNNARASFMTSERTKKDGEWKIRDDSYTKLALEENSIVFIGDIVATGSTLQTALTKIPKNKMKKIIMFTLGGENTEKILKQHQEKNPNHKIIIFYIEGLFHTAGPETKARIKITGTDLLPWQATLAPEFEQALSEKPLRAIERCIVYDGGSRGFHPSHHFEDVLEYTNQVKQEVEKGVTLYDLILERWENAEALSEETKTKLKDPEFAKTWLTERISKLNAQLLIT